MSTSVPRYLTVSVVMVLCVGMFVNIVLGQSQNEGVRYKTKYLRGHRGTLISPSDNEKNKEEVIQITGDSSESEILLPTDRHNYALQPYMSAIKPIPVDVYRAQMVNAKTHYDVLRIFIPRELSDETINNIMETMETLPIGLTGHRSAHFTPEQWARWEETVEETRMSGCGQPVPEVVRVRDILGGGDEEYHPSCVVRYKCRRDSGCCVHEFETCTAIKSEKIIKTVLVAKSENGDNQIHFENILLKEFNVTNDTECGCQKIIAPTQKPCPHPFEYDMNIMKCRCRDSSFKKICRKILKGENKLMPSTIRCIQNRQCRPLDNCYFGDFDMKLHQCPQNDQSGSGHEAANQGQPRRNHG